MPINIFRRAAELATLGALKLMGEPPPAWTDLDAHYEDWKSREDEGITRGWIIERILKDAVKFSEVEQPLEDMLEQAFKRQMEQSRLPTDGWGIYALERVRPTPESEPVTVAGEPVTLGDVREILSLMPPEDRETFTQRWSHLREHRKRGAAHAVEQVISKIEHNDMIAAYDSIDPSLFEKPIMLAVVRSVDDSFKMGVDGGWTEFAQAANARLAELSPAEQRAIYEQRREAALSNTIEELDTALAGGSIDQGKHAQLVSRARGHYQLESLPPELGSSEAFDFGL